MRILISGSTGLVGSAVSKALQGQGHEIARLVRPGTRKGSADRTGKRDIVWDPVTDQFDAAAAEGADALIHLAGASIADGRWNASRKELLRTSRIDATRQLFGALAKLKQPPRLILAASAIGFYGDRGDEILTESSAPGTNVLAGLCREWEAETARGGEFGARVVTLRFGVILAAHGGALPKMLVPFKLGLGGRLGDGRQWMSWVTLSEVLSIVQFALSNSGLAGPVNVVSPNPVQNNEFTTVLAKTLHRPALFPAPAFALRLALGEMADALLLASQRVIPSRLTDSGYRFQQPVLADALAEVLRA
ncbi:MAG TPA: TIGR01777 family oxidoreductase [Candidatus Acidoferrales bacterium]|jgi:hypothetical protein